MTTIDELEPEIASRIETIEVAGDACLAFPRGRHDSFRRKPAKVDVLVPVFNGGANLERCIDSVLEQTCADLHVIVVDNGSTDETFARCCRRAVSDGRVLAYQNAKNVGRVPNWNRCLDLASAPYAKLLMSNDVLLPSFVAELAAALDEQPAAVMARASLSLLGADGSARFAPYFAESRFVPADIAWTISLVRDNVAGCPAAQLLRRAVLEAHHVRFDEELSWAADYDFSTRLFEHGGLAYVRKQLFLFDTGAARFANAGGLVLRFKDECAVRVKAIKASRGLDPKVLDQVVATLAALFHASAAQSPAPEVRAELERVHDDARRAIQSCAPPAAATRVASVRPKREGAPAVSVVIPCYNQASFLAEAVESLVAQTLTDWECIIVNDGSPDDTAQVAAALAAKYSAHSIRIVTQENRGLSEARNTGVRQSRGRYILPFDSDDRLSPTMLARLVAILEGNPGVAIAFTHAQCFGVSNGVWKCGPFNIDLLREANRIPYCSLYRRGVWDAVGGYNPNLNAFEDWDFWIGAAERGFRAEGIDEALFLYRMKAVSMLTEAEARKPLLTARLVMNHPNLFAPDREAGARKVFPYAPAERRARAVPAVSVVVLRRSGGAAFAGTLESVLAQSFQDFEIVVVSDGAAGGEAEVADIDGGRRVRYVSAARSEGRAAARNLAAGIARGRWLAYADEGDLVYPDHLAALVDGADGGKAPVAYGDAHRAGAPGPSGPELALCALAGGDVYLASTRLPIMCLLHERVLLESVGGFDESLGALEEWDFQIRLLAAYRAVHVSRVVGKVGPHADEWRDAKGAAQAGHKALLDAARAVIVRKHGRLFSEAERERNARYAAELASAERMVTAGDLAGGIDVLESCTRAMPYWAQAHNDLAALYHSAGKLGQALAAVVAALELEPNSPIIWKNAVAIQRAVEASRSGVSGQNGRPLAKVAPS